jgi:predicted O-methyltransferase YrrM
MLQHTPLLYRVSSYLLDTTLGGGRIVSIDHDPDYAEVTKANLEAHGFRDLVTVQHAPLVVVELDGQIWKYYDPLAFGNLSSIDMLIIDGPPASVQNTARYPALPLLLDRLSPEVTVLLDDAGRSDELETLRLWKNRYPQLTIQEFPTEKGTAVLSMHGRSDSALPLTVTER